MGQELPMHIPGAVLGMTHCGGIEFYIFEGAIDWMPQCIHVLFKFNCNSSIIQGVSAPLVNRSDQKIWAVSILHMDSDSSC